MGRYCIIIIEAKVQFALGIFLLMQSIPGDTGVLYSAALWSSRGTFLEIGPYTCEILTCALSYVIGAFFAVEWLSLRTGEDVEDKLPQSSTWTGIFAMLQISKMHYLRCRRDERKCSRFFGRLLRHEDQQKASSKPERSVA